MKRIAICLFAIIAALCPALDALSEDPPMKLGVIVPLSGLGEFWGNELQKGIALCQSKNIDVYYEDSQASPSVAVTAFNKLLNFNGIDAVLTSYSGISKAIIPIAKSRKIPQLVTIVSSSKVVEEGGDNVWRYFSSGEQDAPIMAQFSLDNLKAKTAAMIYPEDEYGISYVNAFRKSFESGGGKVLLEEAFMKDTTDYKTPLLRIKQTKSDIVYIVGYDEHLLQIFRKAREVKMQSKLVSNWTVLSPSVLKGNEQLIEGSYFTTPRFYIEDWSEANAFKTEYQQRYQFTPSAYAAIGCDMIRMLASRSADVSIIDHLRSIRGFRGIMGIVNGENNGGSFELLPATLEQGKIKLQ